MNHTQITPQKIEKIEKSSVNDIEEKRRKNRIHIQQWRKENPEKQKILRRRTYLNNKEKDNARSKMWAKNNTEKCRKMADRWRKENPEKVEIIHHKRRLQKYGIDDLIFNELLNQQNGKCAICKKDLPNKKSLHIDHDHKSNKVRGLLCSSCNLGLGLMNDSVELLSSAITYLKKAT